MSKSIFARTSEAVEGFLQSGFYAFGKIVGERPATSISCSLVFAVLCFLGLGSFTIEDRPDKLWIPQDTQAMDDRQKYEVYFPSFVRVEELLITCEREANVLSRDCLSEALDMWDDIERINVTVNNEIWWLDSKLCVAQDGEGSDCFIKSILGAWNYSYSTFEADSDYMTTLNVFVNTSGLSSYLGEITLGGEGNIVSAEAIRIFFLLQSMDDPNDRIYIDPESEAWVSRVTHTRFTRTLYSYITTTGIGISQDYEKQF